MAPIFIDFEAFQDRNGDFMIKELCLLDADRPLTPLYFLFTPTEPWHELSEDRKTSAHFLTQHFHHLQWEEGNTRFCANCLMHHIRSVFPQCDNSIFYIMESKASGPKYHFIKSVFPELNLVNYNVKLDGLPTPPDNIVCPYRQHGRHCAYLKCLGMYQDYTHEL